MICDICRERDANVFLEMQGPSSKKKINICMECATKLGIPDNPSSVAELFKKLEKIEKEQLESENKMCPVCGIHLSTIKKNKVVGCPECYSIFKEHIKEILKNYGVKEVYTGSMPKRLKSFKSVLNDRIILQTKLEESLKTEDYEKAAIYRDYLKALEKTAVVGGDDE